MKWNDLKTIILSIIQICMEFFPFYWENKSEFLSFRFFTINHEKNLFSILE